MSGRWGGRSSDNAGLRDCVIGMDGARYLIDESDYDPVHGGNVIAFDAVRQIRKGGTLQTGSAQSARSLAATKAAETRKRNLETKLHEAYKNETINQFTAIRGRIAESWRRAEEEANKPKTDKVGVTLQNGRAITPNGTVVEPSHWYQPKGLFKGEQTFYCRQVMWKGDRIIAVGDLERGAAFTTESGKWYYPSDLKPARLAGGQLRSGKGRFFGIEI